MESWDDDNFEPDIVTTKPVGDPNKWEGEDVDDDIKDNWEDEDEEKEAKKETEVVSKPKKKPLNERIAEKERLKREEMEKRMREAQDEEDISPEEKLRRQQESDLKLALETTFGVNSSEATIDGLSLPTTKEEFQEFSETLSKKLTPLSKSTEYPGFIESFVRNLCATMSSLDIKKIKNTLDNLYLEKQKIEKGDKTKKNKGKGKAKLKLEDESQLSAYVNDFDDYDDFM